VLLTIDGEAVSVVVVVPFVNVSVSTDDVDWS
jgi:hypothetical protein